MYLKEENQFKKLHNNKIQRLQCVSVCHCCRSEFACCTVHFPWRWLCM